MTLRERCENTAESSGFRCPNAAESGRCDACPVCDKRKRLADAIESEARAFAEAALYQYTRLAWGAMFEARRAISPKERIAAAIEAAGKGTT